MKILHRFILAQYFRILGLCTAAFIGIYLLIDFFEKVDDFINHQAMVGDYLSYLFNSMPIIFVQVLPLAILATMVLTLGGFGRTNELTAMRACGVSIWHIVKPLMVMIAVLATLLLILNEMMVPWNTQNLNNLLEVKLKGKQKTELARNEIWYRLDDEIVSIKVVHPDTQQLKGISIYKFNVKHTIAERIDAPEATFRDGQWLAPTAVVRSFDANTGDLNKTTQEKNRSLPLGRAPQDFLAHDNINSELTVSQLRSMIRKLESEGYDATRQRVDMHSRLASPVTCLIMGFLGIPFALQRGRNSNIALGIGISLAIGVCYFLLQSLLRAFGYSGALPPFIAAWAANLVFLMAGIWLLLNVRD